MQIRHNEAAHHDTAVRYSIKKTDAAYTIDPRNNNPMVSHTQKGDDSFDMEFCPACRTSRHSHPSKSDTSYSLDPDIRIDPEGILRIPETKDHE